MPRPLRNGTFANRFFESSAVQLSSIHSANLFPGGTPLTSWKVNSLNLVKSALFRSLNSNSMGSDGCDGGNAAGAGAFGFDADMLSEVRSGCNTSSAVPEPLKDSLEYLYLCDFLAHGAINSRVTGLLGSS